MSTQMPDKILNNLQDAGFEAYYVGGCVRDRLLGRPIHDWDITTSALPEQTMACFPHCIPTGIKHGTVTVVEGNIQAEVTTYRTDGSYADGRHPDQVVFVRSLREDLARRDFTINAMAMSVDGTVVDLYGGREDLNAGIIRCVGDPELRFREDALRMLRACRFSAQLDFDIEPATKAAMSRCAHLCAGLSVERIRDEIEKTLLSAHPERLSQMVSLGLLECCHPEENVDLEWLGSLPDEPVVRWAGLCRLWPKLDLMNLRLDKRTAHDAMEAGRCPVPSDRLGWKRLLAKQGVERTSIVASLWGCSEIIHEILLSGECVSLRQLAVKGSDLRHLKGAEVGAALNLLLDHVLRVPQDNEKEKLFKILQK